MGVQTRRRIDMAWWTRSSCENHAPQFYGNWACDQVAGRRSWAVLNFCVLVAATTSDTLRQHRDKSWGCRRSVAIFSRASMRFVFLSIFSWKCTRIASTVLDSVLMISGCMISTDVMTLLALSCQSTVPFRVVTVSLKLLFSRSMDSTLWSGSEHANFIVSSSWLMAASFSCSKSDIVLRNWLMSRSADTIPSTWL